MVVTAFSFWSTSTYATRVASSMQTWTNSHPAPLTSLLRFTVHTVTWAVDPGQLLDVDVDELARVPALVAVGRVLRLEAPQLPSPIRRSNAPTVDSGICRHPVIWAPVIRSLRSDRRHAVLGHPDRYRPGGRGPIHQSRLTLAVVAGEPLL
jgi:hypothetical protein